MNVMNHDPQTRLDVEKSLLEARGIAEKLFENIQSKNMLIPGVKESELNERVYKLAETLFGIKKYWHKRIVRAGKNTLCPYKENPPDLVLQENDVVYFDFGPILEDMEADFGRTFIVGDGNPEYKTLLADLQSTWNQCQEFFLNTPDITGKMLYQHMQVLAHQKGYELAEWHCGHLVGIFPHEERLGEDKINYICNDNETPMRDLANNGDTRHWILEVHLINPEKQFGGFVEDLLLPCVHMDTETE